MPERLIVGMITMPFSLSNKERLLWLRGWLYYSTLGIVAKKVTIDIVFTFIDDLDKTIEHVSKLEGWSLFQDTEYINPKGIHIRFMYNAESEELIKQFKHD